MNWFKKQISKFINKEDEDYEYEEYYEDYGEVQSEQLHTQKEPPISKQKTFRFPLIDDDEGEASYTSSKEMFDQMEDDDYGQIGDLSLPKHLNHHIVDSSVYDVEVSGIRDLLANRSKRTGRKTTMKSQPSEQEFRSRASLVFRDAQNETATISPMTAPAPKEKSQRKEQKVESIMPENRKRFVPTDVPSPVYGFAKPSPIKELLDKRKEEYEKQETDVQAVEKVTVAKPLKEATTNEVNENILEEKEPASTNQTVVTEHHEIIQSKEILTVSEPIIFEEELLVEENDDKENLSSNVAVPQTTSFAMDFEGQEKEAVVQDQTVQQLSANQSEIHVKEMIVEQVQIENSTIHIGEVTVVQPSMDDQSPDTASKEDKSRIPFNVLMLKTDKEKWRIQQQLKMAHQPIRVESKPETEKNKLVDVMPEKSSSLDSMTTNEMSVSPSKDDNDFHMTENIQLQVDGTVQLDIKDEVESVTTKSNVEEPIAVITMAPVTSMSSISTNEKIEIEKTAADEISATIEPKLELEPELELASEREQVSEPELAIEPEVVSKIIEHASVESVENQVVEAELPAKPAHVYQKPTDEYLEPPEEKTQDTDWMEQQGDTLVEALSYFQVSAQIESIMQGPAVTQFEITVSHGTKVSKIRNLADDLKLALAAKDIRIQAPIPGKSSIGIEIPNRVSRAVRLSEVTNSPSFVESDSPLEAALGLDLTGKPVTLDLRKMPHGLIAGATGSGKSVCINSILVSLLYKAAPHELKLMLIDPKMVELAPFNHIPHLVSPVITDVKAATAALKWAVEEMERRYQLFAHAGARDITRFNAIADKNNEHSLKLPYILIVIDELADLMMMSPADVEEAICRIAQKARACGIHLIVATQRPSVDVITGLIKSNIPTRIAFAVSSQIDSRTILDGQGAERLLGRGDMLYLGNGMSAPVRLQGTFVTDDEIESIIEHVREQGEPDYIFDQEELLKKTEVSAEQDDLFEDVCRFVYEQGGASTSLIQRKYHIGYNRAARLIDMLESHGFVSEARGSKPRESYITEEDLITMFE
ncbi:DNA translocase FtsK [Lysinibacillus capsici]|uniref:DNA translocase FtsK n=1 Tax=Lysinibacillus capsici TaxID=2115968 RepID=UPI0001DA5582|nr:DNA translocase FtsK [Lysinibacillus capsici]EFI69724.1 DNA translocase ftsK [Lysinibacillus fusiformis ZC1]MBU5250669.1 DNA translocase FtsK [Lysinibacillus capsici]MED4698590.1 DNA translocase FtsK [Lysinibacillus capsici]